MICDNCIHKEVCGVEFGKELTYCRDKVSLDRLINKIEQARDKDKIAEYPYNRCIDIVREVLGNEV